MLRPGNVHSTDRWRQILEPIVERCQKRGVRLLFRADVAFARPEVYHNIATGAVKDLCLRLLRL